ncbi:MAG: hypothetical protein J5830_05960 [Clostridia bacterium]|nr:hypothetical protein [Clostridia bacterium]
MPFAELKTNVSVSKEDEIKIKSELAECVALFPGKTERWLMVNVIPDSRLWFGGSDEPCAIIDIQVFGNLKPSDCEKVTAAVTDKISAILPIPAERIYVKYAGCSLWGWNGSNF